MTDHQGFEAPLPANRTFGLLVEGMVAVGIFAAAILNIDRIFAAFDIAAVALR